MINNFINSVYNHISNGLVNVSKEKKETRINICKSCEHYNPTFAQCKQCGCLLEIKTLWATEKCPLDKWGPEISISEPSTIQPPSGDCGCNKK
jgi:hypothetical protein